MEALELGLLRRELGRVAAQLERPSVTDDTGGIHPRLELLGFAAEPIPMSAGTPFANVLLRARYDGSVAVPAAES